MCEPSCQHPWQAFCKLNLKQTWDNLRTSECLRLLFSKVIIDGCPDLGPSISQLHKELTITEKPSRSEIVKLFELLLFNNLYLSELTD